MRRSTLAVIAAALAVLALGTAPVALGQEPGNGGIGPPQSATPSGEAINQLYWFVFAICAVVFVAVETALVLFVIRFRRRRSTAETAEGPQIHGNTRLEIIWTLIPRSFSSASQRSSSRDRRRSRRRAASAPRAVVEVQGHQFYWEYVYPDGQIAIDRLVLPGRPAREARARLLRREPQLVGARAHREAGRHPGRTNVLRLHADEEGIYEGRCAELCGVFHTVMPTTVEVVSQAEYASHLELISGQDQRASQLALGRETWDRVCAKCHGLAGEGDLGPPVAQSGRSSTPRRSRSSSRTASTRRTSRPTCRRSAAAGPSSRCRR